MRMIDADALVEKYGNYYTEEGTEEGFIGTLKSLIDKQPTIGGWISVKDRLPNTYRHVITYDKYSGVKENFILRSNPWVSWSHGFHITHWMPLPEAPKQNLVDK